MPKQLFENTTKSPRTYWGVTLQPGEQKLIDVPPEQVLAPVPVEVQRDPVSKKFTAGGASLPELEAAVSGDWNRLAKWNKALAKARAGSRNARMLIAGDSTGAGNGATEVAGFPAGGQPSCPAEKVAAAMRRLGQTAYTNAILGNVGSIADMAALKAWDTRIGGTGWNWSNIGGDTFIQPFLQSAAAATLTFTPVGNVDTFVVWYGTSAGSRVFSWAIDGGAATNIDAAGTNLGLASVTIPAGAPGAHTLTLNKVSGSANSAFLIEAYDSTKKGVQVIPMAISGSRVGQLALDTVGNSGLAAMKSFAPDLVVWDQVINEWKNAGDLATFSANVGLVVDAAKVTGDIILITGVPSAVAAGQTLAQQQAYVDAVIAVGVAKNVPVIDTWRQFGSYEADTSIYTDQTHPNGPGYDWMWDPVARLAMGVSR